MKQKKLQRLSLLMAFLLALALPLSASAFQPIQPLWENVDQALARLSHSGTTANCTATIIGVSGTTRIAATMRLETASGTLVRSWVQSVNGSRLIMSESATVTRNGNYRLVVIATVTRNNAVETITISG